VIVAGVIVPGVPHPLLCPDANPGYRALRDATARAAETLRAAQPDLLLIYSTLWPSVIGHQIQAHPRPTWVHVDELFHGLGSIPYSFPVDVPFVHAWTAAARRRGLAARSVAYDGFPVDTGTVSALKQLDPEARIPAAIVSSNVYADRAETAVLAGAARDALAETGRRAVAVVVTSLSNRFFTTWIDPANDHIHSPKDEEWNRKLLELLGEGRLEDVSQLSRTIHAQIRVKKVVSFKPFWFLSSLMGSHNRYRGEVLAYAPVHGTGAAVVTLTPTEAGAGEREFDEDDVEVWRGDREVLDPPATAPPAGQTAPTPAPAPAPAAPNAAAHTTAAPAAADPRVTTTAAPRPVGAYPHARRHGDLLFVSGMGPRQPGTDAIPGGPIRDAAGAPLDYDVRAQTRAVIANLRAVLEAAGGGLEDIVDVTSYLVDMDRDFAGYNEVYAELLGHVGATRTTVAVRALPTPIAVELKVIARARP
jgi:reactive intermediate/imine deaminase